MTLKKIVRDQIDIARDAIAWIALWKVGNSWFSTCFWPEDFDNDEPVFSSEDIEQMQKICHDDQRAILTNAYYRNLGSLENMTQKSLEDGLFTAYVLHRSMMNNYCS